MALNKREKTLAAVTVVLVLLVVGRFLFSAWRGPLNRLRAERDDLQREVDKKQERIDRSQKAQARLDEFNRRSLPSDPQLAASLYNSWLFRLAEKSGFDNTKVDVTGEGRLRSGVYYPLRFTVKADAEIDELTEFLYEFYAVDHLHQIRNVTIKPMEGSDKLDLRLTIEALSLPDAGTLGVDVKEGSFATITNLTPTLKTELVYTGSDGKLADAAKLGLSGGKGGSEFSFKAGETLEKVRDAVNAKTEATGVTATVEGNRLYLRGEKTDAPPARLAASDLDQYDKAIAKRNLFAPYKPPTPVSPESPRGPEPPRFDPCKYAVLTGIVGINDQPEAWLIARTTGKKYVLREGDSFELGDVRAKVIHINRRDAEIEFDGKRWLVPMGDSLREARPLFEASGEEASPGEQAAEAEVGKEEAAEGQAAEAG